MELLIFQFYPICNFELGTLWSERVNVHFCQVLLQCNALGKLKGNLDHFLCFLHVLTL